MTVLLFSQPLLVGFHHHFNQTLKIGFGLPAKFEPGFGRIGNEQINFGGPVKTRVLNYIILIIQADIFEGMFTILKKSVGKRMVRMGFMICLPDSVLFSLRRQENVLLAVDY